MGAWGTDILDNDTSNGVYEDFMELYSEGLGFTEINSKLIEENIESINDKFDCNNFWFALALAQWETKSQEKSTFLKVQEIIETENDLIIWRALKVSEVDLHKRKKALNKFYDKIKVERKKAVPRDKVKLKPIFNKGDCLAFKLDNANYGGCIIIEADKETKFGYGSNLVLTTRINQPNVPTVDDFLNAEILITNYNDRIVEKAREQIVWYMPDLYKKKYAGIYSLIGNTIIDAQFSYDNTSYFGSAGWANIKREADLQFDFEKNNGKKQNKVVKFKSFIKG